jgi:predicted DNA-binding transcriptional regulator AlpA
MSQRDIDLISMADIARVAAQSRATVGNWKSRNPEDFPPERGRGPRGPLYNRAEVIAWLEATGRLDKRPPEVVALWRIADLFRGELRTEDALPVLLVLLALLAKAPTITTWQRLRDATPPELDHAVRAAADELLPYAREVLPAQRLPAQAVAEAIATLSGSDRERVSVMADAVLEQAAKALGHRGGEFLSPPSVRKLIVAIADPVGTVYNPATGVGQLMIDAATSDSPKALNIFGQEINERIWAMAQLNLALHDVAAEVALGDVFAEDRYPQLRADRVISVPPWNQRFAMSDVLHEDPRWVWGEPGTNDGNVAWMQHCLAHLSDDGRAVLVLPNGALFEGGRAGRIRQRIIGSEAKC